MLIQVVAILSAFWSQLEYLNLLFGGCFDGLLGIFDVNPNQVRIIVVVNHQPDLQGPSFTIKKDAVHIDIDYV